jgi:hypothetical protein
MLSTLLIIEKRINAAGSTEAQERTKYILKSYPWIYPGSSLVIPQGRPCSVPGKSSANCCRELIKNCGGEHLAVTMSLWLCHTALRATLKSSEAIAIFVVSGDPCCASGPIASATCNRGRCILSRGKVRPCGEPHGNWAKALRNFLLEAFVCSP